MPCQPDPSAQAPCTRTTVGWAPSCGVVLISCSFRTRFFQWRVNLSTGCMVPPSALWRELRRISIPRTWVNSRIPKAKLPFVGADTVFLVPYDEAWTSLFVEERLRIERALGSWGKGIQHVGSTAVPGVAAKPILDIMVGV